MFAMIQHVHRQMDNLNAAVGALQKGQETSCPSLGPLHRAVYRRPRDPCDTAAAARPGDRTGHPEDRGNGGLSAAGAGRDGHHVIRGRQPGGRNTPIGEGRIMAIMPEGHELAAKSVVSIHDLVRYPFVGVDRADPYGRILARPLDEAGMNPRMRCRAALHRPSSAWCGTALGWRSSTSSRWPRSTCPASSAARCWNLRPLPLGRSPSAAGSCPALQRRRSATFAVSWPRRARGSVGTTPD